MAAALRFPLQRLLQPPNRSIFSPKLNLTLPGTRLSPKARSAFSTTHAVRNTGSTPKANNPNTNHQGATGENPSYPRFSLNNISTNPRVRAALWAALAVFAVAESYVWVTYGPRIMGWGGKEGIDGEGKA